LRNPVSEKQMLPTGKLKHLIEPQLYGNDAIEQTMPLLLGEYWLLVLDKLKDPS